MLRALARGVVEHTGYGGGPLRGEQEMAPALPSSRTAARKSPSEHHAAGAVQEVRVTRRLPPSLCSLDNRRLGDGGRITNATRSG